MISHSELTEALENFIGDEKTFTSVRATMPREVAKLDNKLLRITNQRGSNLLVGSEETILALLERFATIQLHSTSPMFVNLADICLEAEDIGFEHTDVPEISHERLAAFNKMIKFP